MDTNRAAELIESRHYSIVTVKLVSTSERQAWIVFETDTEKTRRAARQFFTPDNIVEMDVLAGSTFRTNTLAEVCVRDDRTIPSL